MKMKKACLVIPTLLLSLTTVAEVNDSTFTLAVIEDTAGSKEIMTGEYQKGLTKLSKLKQRKRFKFNIAMGNCVANVMINKFEQAMTFCDEAIQYKNDDTYLQSIAYSNRGIARFKFGDKTGALDDLNLAIKLDDNAVSDRNLTLLKSQINQVESTQIQQESE